MLLPCGVCWSSDRLSSEGIFRRRAFALIYGHGLTWSFFFTTPGVVEWSLSTDPMAWNLTGEFLFKDIVLLCVCAVLFLASLPQSVVQSRSA